MKKTIVFLYVLCFLMLMVLPVFANNITVTWTAPADDKGLVSEKAVSSYKLVFAETPITDANFDTSIVLTTAIPKTIGVTETYTYDIPGNKHYYFAIKSYDDIGNDSPISNQAQVDFFVPSGITNLSVSVP